MLPQEPFTTLPTVAMDAVTAALQSEAARVGELLRATTDLDRPALGSWNVGQLATHLSQAATAIPALATGELASPIADIWELAGFTTQLVDGAGPPDAHALAHSIEEGVAGFLQTLSAAHGSRSRSWLVEGVEVGPVMLGCHLLNELVVHGYDLATATGRPWKVLGPHASLVLTGFIYGVLTSLPPEAMVDQRRAAGLQVCYDVRIRHGSRTIWIFDHGRLTIEPPGARQVDCHVSADPAALLMVAWKRQSQWSHIAAGRLVAWGRRPWLGLRLAGLVRSP